MGSISVLHWVAVLLVVVLVFGTKKLGTIGGDLGKAVKGFKDGVSGGGEEKSSADKVFSIPVTEKSTIDVKARDVSKRQV